ncbi:MAG: alpha/beta fold hydrolase [Candidatus Nanoarchaeia archaeon]|jgi:pimeloyl-ACP methyl ester carboxylesterase|nr:alpha/beta fold hydrolase [Candidatus Nanoarchaeia archaeon]|tara:strand:+ start:5991 stop:6698 length:708 start_codon:yes stop_codon:yes gene_type:complete
MRYWILLFIVFITACSNIQEVQQTKEEVDNIDKLTTRDGVKISYNYFDSDTNKGVILLHILSKNKETWNDFATKLNQQGYKIIAIDLRGHGESDLDFKDFNSNDYINMALDVEEANNFLREKGANKISIIGASIGANLALNYATQNDDIQTIILLSPGEDYRGVTTLDKISRFTKTILIISSKEDKYAFESSKKLNDLSHNSEFIKLGGDKHGTEMLDEELENKILDWLNTMFDS